jgi:uncharacterized protein YjiS (DUF1127 family)
MLHCTKRIAAMHHRHFKRPVILTIFQPSQEQRNALGEKMNLIRNYRNWRRYRETVNELSRLSNRELNDLGISRGDIPFVARKSV